MRTWGADRDFNQHLGATISAFWAERGFKVKFLLVEALPPQPGVAAVSGVRTDMVNGLPAERLQHDGRAA